MISFSSLAFIFPLNLPTKKGDINFKCCSLSHLPCDINPFSIDLTSVCNHFLRLSLTSLFCSFL